MTAASIMVEWALAIAGQERAFPKLGENRQPRKLKAKNDATLEAGVQVARVRTYFIFSMPSLISSHLLDGLDSKQALCHSYRDDNY